MKAISKLKDEARRHEQRGDWDQAISAYLDVLTAADEAGGGEAELPLFNRVGDLYVRVGRQHDAVHYYEQAADRYAEAGLYNNAIALCNKALRYVPGRLGVLRRLSEYSASQGFLTDARSYLVQYADRAFAEGEADAALAALGEYANASGDPEIRELLGRRLYEQGKVQEGLAELKRAYAMRLGAGDVGTAATMRREILNLEPAAFDDEQEGGTVPLPPQAPAFPPRAPELPDLLEEPPFTAEPPVQSVAASFAAEIGAGIDELEPEGGLAAELLEGFETTVLDSGTAADEEVEALSGLESARDFESGAIPLPPLEGLESTTEVDLGLDTMLPAVEALAAEPLTDLPELEEPADSPDFDLPLLDEGPGGLEPLTDELASPGMMAEPVQDAVPGLDTASLPHDARALPELPELQTPDDPELLPVPELDELPPLDDASPLPELADEEPEDDTPLPLLMEDELLAPGGYVDLRSLIVEPEPPRGDTRFQLDERSPTGDEDDDFAQLLSQFRRKVAENVSPEDAAAHYDLGLAFKDMGLLDEAINELQVALHAGDMRLKVFEELGLCFLLKHEYSIAEKVLRRALEIRPDDELELLGVYYHLGRTYEGLGKPELARDAYERVLALDINFSDVSDRIARL